MNKTCRAPCNDYADWLGPSTAGVSVLFRILLDHCKRAFRNGLSGQTLSRQRVPLKNHLLLPKCPSNPWIHHTQLMVAVNDKALEALAAHCYMLCVSAIRQAGLQNKTKLQLEWNLGSRFGHASHLYCVLLGWGVVRFRFLEGDSTQQSWSVGLWAGLSPRTQAAVAEMKTRSNSYCTVQ